MCVLFIYYFTMIVTVLGVGPVLVITQARRRAASVQVEAASASAPLAARSKPRWGLWAAGQCVSLQRWCCAMTRCPLLIAATDTNYTKCVAINPLKKRRERKEYIV